eukprot:4795742-Amphidinium_carterae.1
MQGMVLLGTRSSTNNRAAVTGAGVTGVGVTGTPGRNNAYAYVIVALFLLGFIWAASHVFLWFLGKFFEKKGLSLQQTQPFSRFGTRSGAWVSLVTATR